MFLDAAHGDKFSHTTMLDRKRAARREPTHRLDPVQEPPLMTVSTNMEVSWLQQELYFLQYWCLAAFTKPIGLVQRCLFSFGRALPAPEPSWNAFWRQGFFALSGEHLSVHTNDIWSESARSYDPAPVHHGRRMRHRKEEPHTKMWGTKLHVNK